MDEMQQLGTLLLLWNSGLYSAMRVMEQSITLELESDKSVTVVHRFPP